MCGEGIIVLVSKKWAGRASALTAATAAGTLVMSGVAFADTLQDTIADNGNAVSLVAGSSASGSAGIRVVGNSAAGDPDQGCNIDAGEAALVLDVVTPAGVTANPDPVRLTECGSDYPVTFTASRTAVSGNATVTVLSGPAGGGTYVNQVEIPIVVAQPAPTNTAPTVSVTGVANAATYQKSSVPQPACSVVDAEDTGESAVPQVSNGAYDALGSHTATCSYTDGGGLSRSATATYTVVRDADRNAPVVGYTISPPTPTGASGWYTGDVSLDWTVAEADSPETLKQIGCVDQSITADQAATSYSCEATSEGGTAQAGPVTIKRDSNGPVVSYDGVVSGTVGANGWYTSDVTVRFKGTDALSGPASATKNATTSGDGSTVSVSSPAFTDNAGNTTLAGNQTSPAFKIDTQAPEAPTATLTQTPNAEGWNKSDVAVQFADAGDNGPSGIAVCTADQPVNTETAGETVSGTCTDKAGNVSPATTVTIKLDKTGPTVSETVTVSGTEGANGWFTSPVEVTFTATDTLSGLDVASQAVSSSGQGAAVEVASPAFTDIAGNTTPAGAVKKTYQIDTQAPNAPTVSLSQTPNTSGWNNKDVVVDFVPADDNGPSGVDFCTGNVIVDTESASNVVTGTCTDRAGNVSPTKTVTIKLDKTGPTVSETVTQTGTLGANDWYTSDVAVTFTATDTLSRPDLATQKVTSSGEGAKVTVVSPAFMDHADNITIAGAVNPSYKIDKTAPTTPVFSGDAASSHYFGNVPAAPTCSSTDATSGVASCVVTGGGTTVGTHTYTATATDHAGHTSTATYRYTVLAWSTRGYFAPVDMGGVWNAVKGGSTVPLKFEVFTGTTELTSTTAVKSFTTRAVACPGATATVDEIETILTGGTSLRYDTTGGQFIQNWQTPRKPGTCAVATTTMQDGSTITANFLFR